MPHAPRLAASLVVVPLALYTGASATVPQGRPANQGTLAAVPTIVTKETVILAADRLMYDRQFPPSTPPGGPNPDLPIDVQILVAGIQSARPDVRATAIRALGRLEEPADVDRIALYLYDADANVRRAAIRALVQSLTSATQERNQREIEFAKDALRSRILTAVPNADVTDTVAGDTLEAIGELPLNEQQAQQVVRDIGKLIARTPASQGAMTGLASLVRRNARVDIPAELLARLRVLAAPRGFGHPDGPNPSTEALRVLHELRKGEDRIARLDTVYHCPGLAPPDCWQVRHLGVQMLEVTSPYDTAVDAALHDPSQDVRLAAVRVAALAIPRTTSCRHLLMATRDDVMPIVLKAIDGLNPICEERDYITQELLSWTSSLSESAANRKWQLGAHALATLLTFSPADAKKIATEIAAPHEIWQVRAVAARIAGANGDEALALRLMKDDEPNVRTEALLSLFQMKSEKRIDVALQSLENKDYQLVLTAASQLKRGSLSEAVAKQLSPVVLNPLMDALERLTTDDHDSSRDPRVELLARLGEYGDQSSEFLAAIEKRLRDVDPVVASAAADTLATLTGARPTPRPTRRPIEQPTEDALILALRPPPGHTGAIRFELEDGTTLGVSPLLNEAPMSIYRLKELIDAGYYNGLTIHRIVPELLIQGGSPGANGVGGAPRFWRDEIGGDHRAGAVALSSRGRHAIDGQFFVDLLDAPQFDQRYTVIGHTDPCFATRILEGTRIVRATVFPPSAGPQARLCR